MHARGVVVPGVAVLALAVVVLTWQWIGLLGSDDLEYADGAMAWLRHGPVIADKHWELRYPVVLPIALCFAVLGTTVTALVLPSLLYFIGIAATLFLFTRRRFGSGAATVAVVLFTTVPVVPVLATTAWSDISEAFFLLLSLVFFVKSGEAGGSNWTALASGMLAGLAFLSRETTVALLIAYAGFFMVSPGMPRSRYVVMAVGFFAVVGVELAWYAAATGDPLYRQRISLAHDARDRLDEVAVTRSKGFVIDPEGNLSVNVYLDPLLVLFAGPKFGLLFYVALPSVIVWFGRASKSVTASSRRALTAVVVAAAVWFAFIALNGEILLLVPRYFLFTAVLACVPAGIGISSLWTTGRRLAASLSATAVLGASFLLMSLQNTDPLFAERALARYAASTSETIHVDNRMVEPVNFLLASQGSATRVVEGEPPPGGLAALGVTGGFDHVDRRAIVDPSNPRLREVVRVEPPEQPLGRILAPLGVQRLLPRDIWRKIDRPGATLVVYRLG